MSAVEHSPANRAGTRAVADLPAILARHMRALTDVGREVKTLAVERQRLGDAAFAAYVATGADTDGARTWQELFLPLVSPSWAEVLKEEVERVVRERDEEAPPDDGVTFTREEAELAAWALRHVKGWPEVATQAALDHLARRRTLQQRLEATS